MMDNLDYGIIGNCRSAALISKNGSIEWCCLPEFNSSSIFAKLLDKNTGGSFYMKYFLWLPYFYAKDNYKQLFSSLEENLLPFSYCSAYLK